jgi:hypothetical protein
MHLEKYALDEEEWEILENYREILEVFYLVYHFLLISYI